MDDHDETYSTPPPPEEHGNGSNYSSRRSTPSIRPDVGRVPPQALDVEQAVLGAMMIEPEAIPRVIGILKPESFYDGRHRRIFHAAQRIFERSEPIDIVKMSVELRRSGDFDKIGGAYYLAELTAKVASAANVEFHARIIAEKALMRRLIETMTGVITQAYDPSTDAFDLLDAAEQSIFQISENQLRSDAMNLESVLKSTIVHLESIHGNEGGITGVPSGFTRVDDLTGGWQPSDLIIIAARPSMGKTALALSMIRNAALHDKMPTPVAIFSLEMSAQQLVQRLLTAEARIDAQDARTGRIKDSDWPRIARAGSKLSAAKIFIDDTPGLGILELRAKSRRLKAEHNIGMIVVDYLQLMHGTRQVASREQEIAQISRSLKALAKELNVPVIALSQLSRAVETRGGDKRPMLSDLRESGSIEQDADVVAFIYRAERYGITQDESGQSTEGIAEVIIGKQRNGPIGTVALAFVSRFARFENLTTYYSSPDGLPPGDGSMDELPPTGNRPPF